MFNLLNVFDQRYIGRKKRRQKLKKIFDAQVLDFSEDNLPTQIATFFEDAIAALPMEAEYCDLELLFQNALKRVTK